MSDNAGAEEEPKKRVPKRILHFSDGTLEEYSSDEDESDICQPRYETQLMQSNLVRYKWLPFDFLPSFEILFFLLLNCTIF